MQFITHRRRQPPTIIIVALIDILIVLVIFLIVTTTFKHQQPTLKLALPESKQARPGTTDKAVVVMVEIDRQPPYLRFNGRPVTLAQLKEELALRSQSQPVPGVAIRADAQAPFEQIIKVMDAAREANMTNFSAFVKGAGN